MAGAIRLRPLLAESFTDPEAHAGTCYKASNWEPVGLSAGYSRHRADFHVPNERPKRRWRRPLAPDARRLLRAPAGPADCQAGCIAPPSGVRPLSQPQMLSLFELLQKAPDPRAKNTRFRIGAVLTLVAMALLAGRREIAELVRFATTLTPNQRRRLGLPRKHDRRAFYQVPGYSVFYSVLTRLDSERFAALVHDWLQARAGTLHCQKSHARTIAEKGGEYLLQIKGNQPTLLAQAEALSALPGTPFLPRPVWATAG